MAEFLAREGGQVEERVAYDDVVDTARNLATEEEAHREKIDTHPPIADRSATTLRKSTARDRLYGRIQETMYIAAVNQPEQETPKIKEKCADCCCYSAICIDKIDYKTSVLRKARKMGWKICGHIAFPLMRNNLRKFLVYSELVAILITLVLSVINLLKGKNGVLDIVFLVITIIGSLLAAIDTIFCLYTSCRLFKNCRKNIGGQTEKGKCQGTESITTEEARTSDVEVENNSAEERGKRTTAAVNREDVLRLIVTEIVLYPLLMCSVFKLIITEAYKFETLDDTLSFVLFLLSALSFGIYVYIVRFMVIIGVIYTTQKIRSPPSQPTSTSDVQFDYSNATSARKLQAYLVYHISAQIVLQILMIICTAARIRHDNQYNLQSESVDESVSVSSHLWFMLISGYVLPIFGYLTFFIVTFNWIQEFPVGLCIDFITNLQMPGNISSSILHSKLSCTNSVEAITIYFKLAELKREFGHIRNSSFVDKLCYPVLSPTIVILCMIFTGLQAAYITSIPGEDFSFAGGVTVTYIAIASFSIVNIFILTVTIFWIATIIIVLIAVLALVALFLAIIAIMVALGITITPKTK